MEDLKYKYENFKKFYGAFGRAFKTKYRLEATISDNPQIQNLLNAGIVKHFELTYETGWRFLRKYLHVTYNRDVLSPEAAFLACQEVRLFPENLVNELIPLVDARNKTNLIYDRLIAQEVCNSIEKHYHVFGKILEIIQLPQD